MDGGRGAKALSAGRMPGSLQSGLLAELNHEQRRELVRTSSSKRMAVRGAMAERFDRCVGVRRGTEICSIAVNDFDRIPPGRRVC